MTGVQTCALPIYRRTSSCESLLDAKMLDGAPQTLLEVDRRRIAEDVPRRADVGPRVANVAGARRREVPLHGLVENAADRLGDGIHADRKSTRLNSSHIP